MNIKSSLHTRALGYLTRREYSRLELERKLSSYAQSSEELSTVLDNLEQRRLLSDVRVVEQILYSRRHKYGSKRIQHELQTKGIANDLIAAALEELKKTELSIACELWRKKFGVVPASLKEKGRQVRYLAGKGFSSEVINKALSYALEAET